MEPDPVTAPDPSSAPLGHTVRFGTAAGRWVLIGTVLGSGIASLDATVVNVALPRLGADLHADFAGLQWVLNGYTLTLASLILVGGALGDRFGRRRIFAIGVVWFALASLLCGIAPDITTLVIARMLQGVGGALLTPGSLAIIQASFHPDDRARAIGAWSGLGGVTTAIGPFVGGYLVDVASWRWIFLLNLPLSALVLWVTAHHVPESRSPATGGRLDWPGALLGALGLAGTTWGLIERSWPIGISGVLMLIVFVIAEARRRSPMLPLGIFRSRQFSATNLTTLFVYAGLATVFFMLGLTLQLSLGYSPIEAGAALFPITAIMLVFSSRAGALAQRIGPRWPMTAGPLFIAGGLLLMTRVEPGRSYAAAVLPAVLVFACGLALTVAPLTATVLAAADVQHSGVASGVNNAVARVGGLLAVAAVPLVAGFHPGGDISSSELVDGFHTTMLWAAGLVVTGAIIALTNVRSSVLTHATADDAIPVDQRHPCFHCGSDAPPLATLTDR
ncbi:MAG: drug resistance transporter, EmrB/QacA subfamily [Ilumatobacteraceae bacterium]|nr:drug resistance transporter, EmrB/QacA subfamily [Ilumatobacteraceae bacterium]